MAAYDDYYRGLAEPAIILSREEKEQKKKERIDKQREIKPSQQYIVEWFEKNGYKEKPQGARFEEGKIYNFIDRNNKRIKVRCIEYDTYYDDVKGFKFSDGYSRDVNERAWFKDGYDTSFSLLYTTQPKPPKKGGKKTRKYKKKSDKSNKKGRKTRRL
jgi:hypothetical protein